MIQLSSLMWAMAVFFAIFGFMRGWNKEIIAVAGTVVAAFFLFQLDSIFRGLLYARVSRDQAFLLQAGVFCSIVFVGYRTRSIVITRGVRNDLQTNILGALVGFLNGYLIGGTLWYFLDINEYPLAPLVVAPAPGSPSDQARELLPIVILGGGLTGSGDFLTIAVIGLFLVVMFVI